tara:strand:- start:1807 stop:2739 length:933 start_codon:yes stop_codon:yes gene_type:complete
MPPKRARGSRGRKRSKEAIQKRRFLSKERTRASKSAARRQGSDPQGLFASLSALTLPTLTTLHLASNNLGVGGGRRLASALTATSSLTSLDVGNNSIDGQDLVRALLQNRSLTWLGLDQCGLGETGSVHLAHLVQRNTSLQTLVVSRNRLRDTGTRTVCEALTTTELHTLDLQENGIGDEGAEAIGDFCGECDWMRTLRIGFNGAIRDDWLANAILETNVALLSGIPIKKLADFEVPSLDLRGLGLGRTEALVLTIMMGYQGVYRTTTKKKRLVSLDVTSNPNLTQEDRNSLLQSVRDLSVKGYSVNLSV